MQLVEKHVIARGDPRYTLIDEAAFKSKNLYNAALYQMRQAFIHEGKYLSYETMDKQMQSHEAYRALPAKVAQQVLRQLADAWKAFREAKAAYHEDPSRFLARPRLPNYKHKTAGRNLLIYTLQALSRGKKGLQRGIIKPSMLAISVKTHHANVRQARIVPRQGFYVVEVVYEQEPAKAPVNPAYYAGIDLGINNLATVASNAPKFSSVIINGRPVKAINQFYNKRRAELQQHLGKPGSTARMQRLTTTRNRRIDHYLHTASKRIIDLLVQAEISVVCIGKNDGWKQDVHLGTRTNQQFVQIPHARFIQMLTYKAQLVGIRVEITEEAYTSKASFLDHDPLPTYEKGHAEPHIFSGKRIKRGLYQTKNGRLVNADWNGAANIIRKVAPHAFEAEGVEDGEEMLASLVVHPVRLSFPSQSRKRSSVLALPGFASI